MIDFEVILDKMEEHGTPLAVRAYVALHYQSGCRISDLLAVDFRCISKRLNISILQGKGSNPITVSPYIYRDFWAQVRDKQLSPMQFYNRFYFYRLYQKFGINKYKGKGKNNFVTHAFRQELAQDINSIDDNKERAQSALGHRSQNSTKHYLDD